MPCMDWNAFDEDEVALCSGTEGDEGEEERRRGWGVGLFWRGRAERVWESKGQRGLLCCWVGNYLHLSARQLSVRFFNSPRTRSLTVRWYWGRMCLRVRKEMVVGRKGGRYLVLFHVWRNVEWTSYSKTAFHASWNVLWNLWERIWVSFTIKLLLSNNRVIPVQSDQASR